MTFTVYTLGCKVNSCESAAITDAMLAAGFEKAGVIGAPDICIVNSCAVTGMSVKKARQHISRRRSENPDSVIVLCGCFPQSYPEEAAQTDADIIIGNAKKADISQLICKFIEKRTRTVCVEPLSREFDEAASGTDLDRTRAFIKIEDGCDRFCTYCIIPTARGRVRSRPLDKITEQARLAAESGHKEVVLTGINLSCYGEDIGATLGDAVIAADVEGIERIRLGSLEPEMMTDAEIEKLLKTPKLCPHFHLSLQSGSDTVLKRMRRRYDTALYKDVCERLREKFPNCSITTDIMVGFAGETDEEFQQSMDFAKEIGFAKVHVFPYSIRKGTLAAMYDDHVLPHVKSMRAKQMTELAKQLEQEYLKKQTGREYTVLIEKPQSAEYSNGFTESYIPVRIYGKQIERHSLVRVRITGAEADYCTAELI
ncbi:MAG: tRNA (N(6)-L-threonylcarbamoyladenosine(37)-C(2))-methylthiotransferase MtaB [Ruminococcaceae bacterium]|nr:tRNA (N(6)-L-threonylcarbamoyladenosine(37)-C(2))-methylthiotransferase MtaB [Oscillospiraceae bacterium]